MKILYIAPSTIHPNKLHPAKNFIDRDTVKEAVYNGINSIFQDAKIESASNIGMTAEDMYVDNISNFDTYIVDITGGYSPYTYIAGVLEGLGKPIIYIVSNDSAVDGAFKLKNILQYSKASLNNEFIVGLNRKIEAVKNDPKGFSIKSEKPSKTEKAFISYSHKDQSYLDRLMIHLKPLVKKELVDVWVDTKIKTGDVWEESITSALNESRIAILLISADFLASDFIVDNELPPILSKAEVNGTKILPVIISPCRFLREKQLNRFQSVNAPNEPLSLMDPVDREKIYDTLAHELEQAIYNT